MRFIFADASRPARMSKLVRSAFAAQGKTIGLTGAQDVCARLYGYPTYHELKACIGRGTPCRWDEHAGPGIADARSARQVESLVADGLPRAAAVAFVEGNRPTGLSRRGSSVAKAAVPRPDAPAFDASRDGPAELLIRRALGDNASDIHIEPRGDSYSVFLRILGERRLAHIGTPAEYAAIVDRLKDRSRMERAERGIGQDGGFQVEHAGRLVDLRVATIPSANGEQVIVRILDPDRVRPRLEQLGISNVREWKRGIERRNGLCLICGETGSGKTTTLNASVRELDRFGKKIYAAEDPVEYRIPFVGQVSMNDAVGYGFAQAIRNFMHADPDIMVLGEIRDGDTARNAVKAAETGHLVIATLHTGNILSSFSRLRDLGIPPHELRFVLRAVLVQTLAKVRCAACAGTGSVGKATCATCSGTGHSDRTILSECRSFGTHSEIDEILAMLDWRLPSPRELPWTGMVDDGIDKMLAGIVDSDEMRRLFGSEFLDRCRERGIDPAAYARRKPLDS